MLFKKKFMKYFSQFLKKKIHYSLIAKEYVKKILHFQS